MKQFHSSSWRVIVFLAVSAVSLSFLIGLFPILFYGIPKTGHEFGDTFGFMNAFVSACAFTALVVTMIWQRDELKAQQESIVEEIRNLNASLTVDIHSQLFTSNYTVLKILLDNPKLCPFIYGDSVLSESDDEDLRQRVRVLCEFFSDHFELVCIQMPKVENEPNWKGWRVYMTDIISKSPQLRKYLQETTKWKTTGVFQEIVKEAFQRAGEEPPF